jgi:hypothetical protein
LPELAASLSAVLPGMVLEDVHAVNSAPSRAAGTAGNDLRIAPSFDRRPGLKAA